MLTPKELKHYSQTSAWMTWRAIGADWAIIGLTFTIAAKYPNPLLFLFLIALMARQQLALGLLMHDAAHGRLFQSRAWNDVVCQFFCSGPLFFSLYSYKSSHLKHHTHPLAPDDPDLSLIGGYPIDRKSFVRKLSRDLFGISYFKFIKYFLVHSPKRQEKVPASFFHKEKVSASFFHMSKNLIFFSMIASNVVLFTVLNLCGHPYLYLFLWVLPSMTFLQVLLRIRGIAEHAGYQPHDDQSLNSRTVVNPVQTFIGAPHCVNYHLEHHLYPSVPFFRLPEVHRILKSRGSLPPTNIYSGYGEVLRDLVKN